MYCKRFSMGTIVLAVVVFINGVASARDAGASTTLDTDPNLTGWWKLDETSGTIAADSSRYQRDGTLQAELSFDEDSTPGRMGGAIRFDGKDVRIEVNGYKGITGTRPRTVAAWIKTAKTRGEIVSWGKSDFGQMFTFGFIRRRIGITPSGGYFYMSPETHDDNWHHVTVVVQEAELPNLHDHVTLYLDGVEAEVHDIGLLDLWPLQTGNELDVRIGRGFSGLLDDLRLYNRPLNESEIKALFDLGNHQSPTSSDS